MIRFKKRNRRFITINTYNLCNRKLTKPRKTFSFKLPISIEGSWMLGLTNLEIYNSIFKINTTKVKFEIYAEASDEFTFTELKDELEENLSS